MSLRTSSRVTLLSASIVSGNAYTAGSAFAGLFGAGYIGFHAAMTYGTGGTSASFYVQTTFDSGANWIDVANFNFTTGAAQKFHSLTYLTGVTNLTLTSGTLAANTINNGVFGDQHRVLWLSTGTYSLTTMVINAIGRRL